MRCPFCAEHVRDDAAVCRHCGNDLKVPETLLAENLELKKRLAALQHELTELTGKAASRGRRRSG
jgi:predicted amidophosphoribosyltransferase